MNRLLALLLFAPSWCCAQSIGLPYNPDADEDYCYGTNDLLSLLGLFGSCEPYSFRSCGDSIHYWGYWYPTTQIGSDCWMQENLRTTHYRNGDSLHMDPNANHANSLNDTHQGFTSFYGSTQQESDSICDDWGCQTCLAISNSIHDYGRVYNTYAILDERGLCPTGWMIADDSSYMRLVESALFETGSTSLEAFLSTLETGCTDVAGTDALGFRGRLGGWGNLYSDTIEWTGRGWMNTFWSSSLISNSWDDIHSVALLPHTFLFIPFLEEVPLFSGNHILSTLQYVRCVRPSASCGDPLACNFEPTTAPNNTLCTYPTLWYQDTDGDGLGEGSGVLHCDDPQSNMVDNNADMCYDLSSNNYLHESNTPCTWDDCQPVHFDNYLYTVIKVGEQCWFAENLKTTRYANGDSIVHDLAPEGWLVSPDTLPGAYVFYGDNNFFCNEVTSAPLISSPCNASLNASKFGALYNGFAALDPRNLCPNGWHVPTESDWHTLELHAGYDSTVTGSFSCQKGGDFEENLMAPDIWYSKENLDNALGWSALPAGEISIFNSVGPNPSFQGVGLMTRFWSSTEDNYTHSRAQRGRQIQYDRNGICRGRFYSVGSGSVRCIKD